jgi:hypothetical protein
MTLQVRVGAEWVNNFLAPCTQNTLSYRDDHANGFYNQMVNHGHVGVFCWGNNDAWETDYRHPNFGGDSLNNIDNVHFMFTSTHGGNWNNTHHLAFAVQHQYCLSSSQQMLMGPRMLKWIVFDCCQMVLNVDSGHIVSTWGGPMSGGVHLIFGFIGNGTDSWWNDDLGSDFGDDVRHGNRLANSWLDEAYSWWLNDDAIAIAAGVDRNDAINRRENESIDWRDFGIASCNYLAWKYRR